VIYRSHLLLLGNEKNDHYITGNDLMYGKQEIKVQFIGKFAGKANYRKVKAIFEY
jgi:hypothetical protein